MPDKGCALHWTVNTPPAEHAGCVALWDQIIAQHAAKGSTGRSFYNWGYCDHAQRLKGRGWERQSGANGTSEANREFWALAWIGGPGHVPSDGALAVLGGLIVEAPGASVARPHSDFYQTACPGPDLTAFARSFSGQASPPPTPPQEDDVAYTVADNTQEPKNYWMISGVHRKRVTAEQVMRLAALEGPAKVEHRGFMPGFLIEGAFVDADATSGLFSRLFAYLARLWPKKAERAGTP